jgi:hypothetical protein
VRLDEAVALLGLTSPFGPKEVRRAYLRLLKVHKPEKDPEGFMRLREAYELFSTFEVVSPEGEPARDEPAPFDAKASSDPLVETAPAGDDAGSAVDEEASVGEPFVAVDPASLPPWQRGIPADPKLAAALLCEWIALTKRDASAPAPPMASALTVLWEMLERRAFKTAGELYRAMDEQWLQLGGARGQLAWGMTQGLWEMRKAIPPEVYAPMVRAVAARDPAEAAEALRAFAEEMPASARSLQRRLASKAPQLASAFGRYLATEPDLPVHPPGTRPSWLKLGWAVPVLFLLIRMLGSSCGGARSSDPPRPPPAPPELFDSSKQVSLAATRLATRAASDDRKVLQAYAQAVHLGMQNADCAFIREQVAACSAQVATIPDDQKWVFVRLVEELQDAVTVHCGNPLRSTDASASTSTGE